MQSNQYKEEMNIGTIVMGPYNMSHDYYGESITLCWVEAKEGNAHGHKAGTNFFTYKYTKEGELVKFVDAQLESSRMVTKRLVEWIETMVRLGWKPQVTASVFDLAMQELSEMIQVLELSEAIVEADKSNEVVTSFDEWDKVLDE